MIPYKNTGGNSGVIAYECGSDYMRVRFSTGKEYLYTYKSAGENNIEQMKKLAQNGNGLNSFIMKVVKTLYVK